MELQAGNLSSLIHLALTPAFLLIGAGGFLRVLTNRLARIIDRARKLESRTGLMHAFREAEYRDEMAVLVDRKRIILYAIGLCGACALLVCLVIVTLFFSDLWDIQQDLPVAILFILAAFSLIGSLALFVKEILLSDQALHLTIRQSPPARRLRRK